MHTPEQLLYATSHEWVLVEGDQATVGITDFAQHELGDITFVDLPTVGTVLTAGGDMGAVESVKAASDLYSPVSGTVVAINALLEDNPELVNKSPYTEGWLIKVALSAAPEGLLSASAYADICD